MTTWVFTEEHNGRAAPTALELLAKAREFGDVSVFYVGAGNDAAFAELGDHGATAVHYMDPGGALPAAAAAAAFADLLEGGASLALFAMGNTDRDVAGRLSARMGRAVVANALDVIQEDAGFAVVTEILGGTEQVLTTVSADPPVLVVVRPKAFAAEPVGGSAPTATAVAAPDVGHAGSATILERHEEASEGPDLEAAAVVVTGGRGMGDADRFQILNQLAELIDGAVGATRAVVDAGWVPYSLQVGQTGKTVKPTVYLACGVSGAMQHAVGMKDSATIIAINKDPEAAIFSISDLGIVGDVHKVVPALIEALQARG
jgi:electron transfer flavoprotein alpha subunit